MRLKHYLCIVGLILGSGFAWADGGANTVGWQSLFNGKDLSGWVKMNGGSYTVTNGVIHLEAGRGWLRTEKEFTDFVLEVEARGLETNFNSGIFLRSPLVGNPWATNVWQVNVKQSAIGELLGGSNKVVMTTMQRPVGKWMKFRIEVRGRAIALEVDGDLVWKFQEFPPCKGFLGLQAEGKTVEFRNLRIGELPSVDAPVILPLRPL